MNITVDRAVIEQALEALEEAENVLTWDGFQRAADALRVALGQQYMTNAAGELEPVTVVKTGVGIGKPDRKVIEQALEALEKTWRMDMVVSDVFPAMQALSKALRELEKQND